MAGSKEHLRCINAEILLMISQIGKIFIRFVVPSTAIRKILNAKKASLKKKTFFFKKNSPLVFLKTHFLGFLKRNKILLFLQRKQKRPILNCFYSIIQYYYFQNYTIITCYTYYGIQN